MVFIYLSIGLLLTYALHCLLRFFSTAEPRTIRRTMGWGVGVGIILLIVLFLRFGLPHMAAILSFAAVAAPLFKHFTQSPNTLSGRAPSAQMDVKEACEVLNVSPDASTDDIQKAHRQMIHKNHPDSGGSEYLASKINEARDVLLSNRKDKKS